MAGAAAAATGAASGFGSTGVQLSAVDGLCAEVQKVGDSASAAAAAAGGSVHGVYIGKKKTQREASTLEGPVQ
jgi:hypothetical protein